MEMFEDTPRYVSLSNKYRPQAFEDMVGQETISKTLANAIKLNRIGHAYLFYGPRGCGKTTTARILAKALNCTAAAGPSVTPCGKCPQCLEIAAGSDLDVLELDAASNTQVEKIREAIIDTVALAAARDRYKIFILDEVHMLSDSSFNALLKTIEEPPAHVIFILATTEKHKVPATIASRCQTFRFRPITQADIAGHLEVLAKKENLKVEPKALKIIAAQAGGALRDALTMLDRAIAYSDGNITEELVRDMLGLMPEDILKAAVTALVKKDSAGVHNVFETLQKEGFDALTFLHDLKNSLGALFYLNLGHGLAPFEGAAEIAKEVSPSYLAALTRKINKVIEETKFADTPFITAEVGLFTVMDSVLDIDGFVKRLEALESAPEKKNNDGITRVTIKPAEIPAGKIKIENEDAAQKTPKVAHAKIEAPVAAPDFKKLKAGFKDNYFIFDALSKCAAETDGDNWNLKFSAANSFYATALEVKISELEQKAREIFGRTINFTFAAETAPAPAPKPVELKEKKKSYFDAPSEKQPARPPLSASDSLRNDARSGAEGAPKIAKEENLISREEPFAKGDYSYIFETEVTLNREVPDYVRKILDIVPGEVIG
ncbi:MAG: DNA polymerase III subunit gamma/tau [Elusimicrobium sp.]|jgi:DNA polymerase-3 subunit gamma/tau|nr:DNA polymerase III subunit gamma/tau [Elusimicrobium sp.]